MKNIITKILKASLYILIFLMVPLAALSLLTSKTTLIPGIKSFIVSSGSMAPTLPVGSMVYVQNTKSYNKGEIISFKNAEGLTVTHRIVKVVKENNDEKYMTIGDANNTVDSVLAPKSAIIGKSFISIPYIGSFIVYLKTPFGFFSMLIVPILVFVLSEFLNLKREFEKELERRVTSRLSQ